MINNKMLNKMSGSVVGSVEDGYCVACNQFEPFIIKWESILIKKYLVNILNIRIDKYYVSGERCQRYNK